mgnify:CR=1 FL=1
MEHDDVSGRADELLGWSQVGVRVDELLEEVAAGDTGRVTGGPDLGDDGLDVVHGSALAGPARRPGPEGLGRSDERVAAVDAVEERDETLEGAR